MIRIVRLHERRLGDVLVDRGERCLPRVRTGLAMRANYNGQAETRGVDASRREARVMRRRELWTTLVRG